MNPRVTFYDVPPDGRWPLVVRLAEAAWRKGTAMIIHCADEQEARALDEHLWIYKDEAFLPHEVANSTASLLDREARIVIVTREERPVDAAVLVQVTPASEPYARGFGSVIDLVDHRDPALLAQSRARFRAWREAGVEPAFKPA